MEAKNVINLEEISSMKFKSLHCKKHGPYKGFVTCYDGLRIEAACPKCKAEAEEEEKKTPGGKILKEIIDEMAVMRLYDAEVDRAYFDCTFESYITDGNPKVESVVRAFRAVAEDRIKNLTCIGATGVGKTHLAVAALRLVAENESERTGSVLKGKKILYIRESALMRRLKANFSDSYQPTEAQVMGIISQVDLLVIDEVGKAMKSDYNSQALEEIIDRRYTHKRTILLSNLSERDLASHLSDGTKSRLSVNAAKMVLARDQDWRRIKK